MTCLSIHLNEGWRCKAAYWSLCVPASDHNMKNDETERVSVTRGGLSVVHFTPFTVIAKRDGKYFERSEFSYLYDNLLQTANTIVYNIEQKILTRVSIVVDSKVGFIRAPKLSLVSIPSTSSLFLHNLTIRSTVSKQTTVWCVKASWLQRIRHKY